MFHKPSEVNLEELYLSIEAEELVIFQFVIFSFEFCYLSIDNQIFTPPYIVLSQVILSNYQDRNPYQTDLYSLNRLNQKK